MISHTDDLRPRWINTEGVRKGLEGIVGKHDYETRSLEESSIPKKRTPKLGGSRKKLRELAPKCKIPKRNYSGIEYTHRITNVSGGLYAQRIPDIHPESARCYIEIGEFYTTDEQKRGRYERMRVEIKRETSDGNSEYLKNPIIDLLIAEYEGNILVWRRDQSKNKWHGRRYQDCNLSRILRTDDRVNDTVLEMLKGKIPQRKSPYFQVYRSQKGPTS